ncbi:MAG: polysaccharide deacetylase family protein [Mycobacteriales bacterium]
MLYVGVAWHARGYEVCFRGDEGRANAPATGYRAAERDALVAHLRRVADQADGDLVVVVESTNGILDGGMMAAGLRVYRADPWTLPDPPSFGSVGADALAEAARRDLSALTRLRIDGGTLTGRISELLSGISASAQAERPLREAGRWFDHGDRDMPVVALTFDDGPHPPYTGQVLDVLDRYGVPATFFCVGLNACELPGEISRITAAGHAVANHTWSHAYLPDLARDGLREQVGRTSQTLERAAGRPVALFRPPYGSRTPEVVGWLGDEKLTTVLWDVEAADWALPGADVIARRVLDQVRPGSVILLHDGGGDRSQTAAALPSIIEGVRARGLRFVLVEELDPHC